MYKPHVLICAVVTGIAIAAFTVPRLGVPRVSPGFNPSSLSIRAGQTLEQLLAVSAWGFHAVSLQLSAPPSAERLDVELEQRDNGGVPVSVVRTTIALQGAQQVLPLRFAPFNSGPTTQYILRLQPQSASGIGEVSFQATEAHEYREGRLWLDGTELALDLVFDTEALTGSPWPAFASILYRRTGVRGLEWLFAAAYLGSVCAIVRFATSPAAV